GYTGANPCAKLERNREEGRETFLIPEQVAALRVALDTYAMRIKGNDIAADCLAFILATGCRRGEAMKATWNQFDGALTIWTKPSSHTKQKKMHRSPLSPMAQAILIRRRGECQSGDDAVFPGKYGALHIRQLRSAWNSVTRMAGLPSGIRVHDLRHSF